MKTFVTVTTILALSAAAYALTPAKPAECDTCMLTGIVCYGQVACGENCICIQPNGPGSEGWCN
jgi:hypothetical protein